MGVGWKVSGREELHLFVDPKIMKFCRLCRLGAGKSCTLLYKNPSEGKTAFRTAKRGLPPLRPSAHVWLDVGGRNQYAPRKDNIEKYLYYSCRMLESNIISSRTFTV